MIREIVKDTSVLSQVSKRVKKCNKEIIKDMIDTAEANKDRCVGLAAIQINEPVRIIIFYTGERFEALTNPVIIEKSGEKYISKEGCMSLDGEREVERFKRITVMHEKNQGKFVKEKFSGFVAQIIQHECDHLNGILI